MCQSERRKESLGNSEAEACTGPGVVLKKDARGTSAQNQLRTGARKGFISTRRGQVHRGHIKVVRRHQIIISCLFLYKEHNQQNDMS